MIPRRGGTAAGPEDNSRSLRARPATATRRLRVAAYLLILPAAPRSEVAPRARWRQKTALRWATLHCRPKVALRIDAGGSPTRCRVLVPTPAPPRARARQEAVGRLSQHVPLQCERGSPAPVEREAEPATGRVPPVKVDGELGSKRTTPHGPSSAPHPRSQGFTGTPTHLRPRRPRGCSAPRAAS